MGHRYEPRDCVAGCDNPFAPSVFFLLEQEVGVVEAFQKLLKSLRQFLPWRRPTRAVMANGI